VALAEELTSNFMHVGTQFDALGHIGIGDLFFNGNSFEDVFTPTGLHKLGVEEVPPFFTRGVLIDVAAAKGVEVLDPGYEVTARDIELALDRQGMLVELENGRQRWDINPGDVVLIHTGWGSLYSSDPEAFAGVQPGLGVAAARALAEKDVVMVGADNVFVDVFPNPDGLLLPVHQELLTRNGIYMMEVVKTDELARNQVYEFAFSFAPIRVEGGTGSAAHPFAIT
jgi:kynurenine formamidase